MFNRFTERLGFDREAERKNLEEVRRAAEAVRQMLNGEGWRTHVVPFTSTYQAEVLAELAAPPKRDETPEVRAHRDNFLRGCLEGQQSLLAMLSQVVNAESEALKEDAAGADVDTMDNPTLRRFG